MIRSDTIYLCHSCGGVAWQPYEVRPTVVFCESCTVKDFKERYPFTWNLGLYAPTILAPLENMT